MKFNPRSLYMHISRLAEELESTRNHIVEIRDKLTDLNDTAKKTQKDIYALIEDINAGKWG